MQSWRSAFLLLTFCLALPHTATAAGIVGTGTPESCTEAALDAALAGDGMVTFNCGLEPMTITLRSEKVITTETTVDGGGLVTLSGGHAVRVLRIAQAAVLHARNLTVADGKADQGGGIYVEYEGTLTMRNCVLVRNYAFIGGAIVNGGTLTVTSCVFSENRTSVGCAAGVCGSGAAIANVGDANVTRSTFSGNSSTDGGAIFNLGGTLLTNSTLDGNSAEAGGGIYNLAGTLTATNLTLTRDSAASEGGGIGTAGGP